MVPVTCSMRYSPPEIIGRAVLRWAGNGLNPSLVWIGQGAIGADLSIIRIATVKNRSRTTNVATISLWPGAASFVEYMI